MHGKGVHSGFWWKNLKERYYYEDLGLKIILKWIETNQCLTLVNILMKFQVP
jgi:hypothetical protein